ncbi:unnamed protein product [Phyllotreta striolata]|uniref:XPG N-terminal domain-containing protein n=1 Tax=Phyllotreta striolata TaxID=444603 RepID=A0A9N9TN10_PHYSR|nr:unnamed protein product [Phyllotreta striolata]
MGIRGLTTFIENRSHFYLENYQLHDTNLVIDGNSIACQLYRRHNKSLNDSFGGDYDRFAGIINNFFNTLQRCNITPLIVYDGGYETKKVHTINSRMKNRIKAANQLNPTNSFSVFPLFQRHVFEDVVEQRGIKSVRCDFEGDTEITNIAKALDCPILSYDSDFFIFDALYIPFSYFEISVKSANDESDVAYKYISCKVYKVDKFLKSFPGLQKSCLPILAVLLGNDYVKRSVFAVFYQNLKMQTCRGSESNQQKVIKSLLTWLQNETIESALSKVLGRYCKAKRQKILKKINVAINGYNSYESRYMRYLDVNVPKAGPSKHKVDLLSIDIPDEDEEIENNDAHQDQDDDVSSEEDENVNIPSKFQDKFRRCIYPASFMDILVRNRYYCVPQVENVALENSHTYSQATAKKRRKKRKKREDQPENIDDIMNIDDLELNSDDEASFDPNNLFSVLRNN